MNLQELEIIFTNKLHSLIEEHVKVINQIPEWFINSSIPLEFKKLSINDKRNILIEKYKNENQIYRLIKSDLDLIQSKKQISSPEQIKSIQIDPRFLESLGLNNNQIESYFHFIELVKSEL